MAAEQGALALALEHRFYGPSMPKPDFSTEHLAYLSSQQALGDLVHFHAYASETFGLTPEQNKWVTFGGSYPGMLAAWARLEYPHLIHVGVSSSSPVRAEANMQGYNDVVAESLE